MTPKERAAMRQAIEFIVDCEYGKAELALREALTSRCQTTTTEQAEQSQLADASLEPVAEVVSEHTHGEYESIKKLVDYRLPCRTKLYAAPLAKQDTHATHVVRTKDLTDDEILPDGYGVVTTYDGLLEFARAVIAADREKNK